MQELPAGLVPGTLVHARGEQWRVRHTRVGETASLVTLDSADATGAGRVSTLLVPIDRVQPVPDREPVRRRRQRVIRGMLDAVGGIRPANGLWCAAAAHMDVWPWQLAPALAVVREGATRLLLADAVGLGKTVQAGLVLAELRARGLADRAVVLAPAAVRTQWADELRSRFGLPAQVIDLRALLDLEHTGPAGINPWRRLPIVISSIDLVKRAEVRASVEDAPIDLLIVDEAHHATPGTDRHAVVNRLARQAAWVLLVSATPHSGDAASYQALLEIGGGEAPRPLRIFRRTESHVAALVPRRTRIWLVRASAAEARLYGGVLAYARRLCEASPTAAGAQLFASLLARRAASSARAARLTLERRLDWLSGEIDSEFPRPQPLPWQELDSEESAASWVTAPGLSDRHTEQRTLHDLIERARAAEDAPSKLRRLVRFVNRVREPVIVFSEFRDTLDACAAALGQVAQLAVLSGELDAGERKRRLDDFLDRRARVLLTTDVAGEGLNLHQAARLVVTMEWPWSPLRLEQRIGRVHRLGQRHVVHAVHLTAASSYEEVVVAHVQRRAARAEADLQIADAGVEHRIAALVLNLPLDPIRAEHPPLATPETNAPGDLAEREASRVNLSKTLLRYGDAAPFDAVWALPHRRTWTDRVVVLIEVLQQRPCGGTRGTSLVAVQVTLREAVRHRRVWRRCAAQLARDPRVHEAAIAAAAPESTGDQWTAVRDRLDALWRADAGRWASPRVQPSLFDRRAMRSSVQRRETAAERDRWRAALQSRLIDLPVRVSTRTIAVLPLRRQGASCPA